MVFDETIYSLIVGNSSFGVEMADESGGRVRGDEAIGNVEGEDGGLVVVELELSW